MAGSIEVFRDLYMRGSFAKRADLARALIAAAEDPWSYDLDRLAAIDRNATDAAILAFSRSASDHMRAARLTLGGRDDGYYVANVVPIEGEGLGITEYNAILADFIKCIVQPVAPQFDYKIDTTEGRQRLEDWTSPEAAQKLHTFSVAANKSTRASHPMDEGRWFDFVIAVHESRKVIQTGYLIRYLHEIEMWDEESARELASQYETALSLLKHYNKY